MDEFAFTAIEGLAVVSLKIQECKSISQGHRFKMAPSSFERFVYIISGNATFDIGDRVIDAGVSDVVYFPRNTEYCSEWNAESDFIVIDISLCDTDDKEISFGDSPTVLFHDEFGVYEGLFKDLVSRKAKKDAFDWLEKTSICLKFLCEMARDTSKAGCSEKKHDRIRQSITYLENNFAKDFSIDELAKISYLSPTRFRDIFFECMGMSPVDYRNTLRIRRATELLKNEKYSISEVAEQVGITDIKYFGKLFKRYIGTSPGAFKKRKSDKSPK